MANEEHLAILRQGVEVWNQWREERPGVTPYLSAADLSAVDLSGADLKQAYLNGSNLTRANLSEANLSGASLVWADLGGANLQWADLLKATLQGAKLGGANLQHANLEWTDLREAKLVGADLSGVRLGGADLRWADLGAANLTGCDFTRATLRDTRCENTIFLNCRIHEISAVNLDLTGAVQSDLIISGYFEPDITVDNLEIALFIAMVLYSEKIRGVMDITGKKSVLILGRFTEERKPILEAIKNELRQRNYIPILFDFEKPASRDLTETIVTLAHLSRFVIADITDAKSIPQELKGIVPSLPSVAVQPIIHASQVEYGMFEHIQRFPWVLPTHEYMSQDQLIAELAEKVIAPAERKVIELRPKSL